MDGIKKTIKVAVIFPDTIKEEKLILKKAFDAYGVPVDLFPYPSFKYQDLKEHKIIVACGEVLFQQVDESVKQGLQVWHFSFPIPSHLVQKEENKQSRIGAVETIQIIKTKLEELQKKAVEEVRKFTKEELVDLTATTIMSLCTNKIDSIVLDVSGRTITVLLGKQKKTTKLDKNTFTLEELLVVKLVQELLGVEQVSVVEKEEEKR